MTTNEKGPILVTGSHRSGSTWVGRMIALSPAVGYIHEPFNVLPQSEMCGGHLSNWFTYVCDENGSRYHDWLKECLAFKHPLARKLRADPKPRAVARHVLDYGRFCMHRLRARRPLVKDPIAIFSADWLARTFDMQVIVLTRHPAAFAGSIKQAGWPHPFQHFLNQPLLMRDHLAPFTQQIQDFAADQKDIIDQAILLWNLIYATILTYRREHPEWVFVRHEDISADPILEFGDLFRKVGLDYPALVQDKIAAFSRSRTSARLEGPSQIQRDSKTNIWQWKNRLTTGEIDRVRFGTGDISRQFYDDDDW